MPITRGNIPLLNNTFDLTFAFEHTTGSYVGGKDFTRSSGSFHLIERATVMPVIFDRAHVFTAEGTIFDPRAGHIYDRFVTNEEFLLYDNSAAIGDHQVKHISVHVDTFLKGKLFAFTFYTDADGNFAFEQK